MSNPKTQAAIIKFDYPVQLADRVLSEVALRRPTLGDMLDYPVDQHSGLKEETALVAHLCGLVVEDLRGIDAGDYNKLQDQLLRFRGISIPK
jgi:hypothetical protein